MPQDRWIEIEQRPDGWWRWIYREPGEDVALESNKSYADRQAAAEAARTAYPDVTVWGAGTEARAQRARTPTRLPRWLAFLLGTFALWRATRRAARE